MAVVGVMYNLKGDPPEEGEPPDLGAELDSESSVQYARAGSSPASRTNEIKGSRVFVNPGIKYKTV